MEGAADPERHDSEIDDARRALAAISELAGRGDTRRVIGVLDPVTEPAEGRTGEALALDAIRMAVTVAELRRRLAGFDVRGLTLSPEPMVSELGDDVVQSLAPWGPTSADELASELDGLVLLSPQALSPDAEKALSEIEQSGLAVCRLSVDSERPDPLVLAGRLADPKLLELRREYLAVGGRVPAVEPYVLSLPAGSCGTDTETAAKRKVVRPEGPLLPVDLLALVASADEVVTGSPAVAAVAAALGRPVAAAADRADVADLADLAGLATRADRSFDDLQDAVLAGAGRRLAPTLAERLAALERRVATLEAVNSGLRRNLARERAVMAWEVRRRDGRHGDFTGPWSTFSIERMTRDLNTAHSDIARLQAEIDRIYATRTMRTIAPVRRAYQRLRRMIPGSP